MMAHKKSASRVTPKWVKSNERREKSEEEEEQSVQTPGPKTCATNIPDVKSIEETVDMYRVSP